MMKKLLAVAMLLAVVANVEAGRCGRNRNCSPCKTERVCEPCVKSCIRPACVVDCISNTCEGEKPNICALTPARVDVVKHVDTNIYYTCAELKDCQVRPTQEQVDFLIGQGHLEEGTKPCPK